jgi:hypothetical protein
MCDLPSALDLGARLGYTLPTLLGAVVIEVGPECHEFGDEMTPAVAAAIAEAARLADHVVRAWAERAAREGTAWAARAAREGME